MQSQFDKQLEKALKTSKKQYELEQLQRQERQGYTIDLYKKKSSLNQKLKLIKPQIINLNLYPEQKAKTNQNNKQGQEIRLSVKGNSNISQKNKNRLVKSRQQRRNNSLNIKSRQNKENIDDNYYSRQDKAYQKHLKRFGGKNNRFQKDNSISRGQSYNTKFGVQSNEGVSGLLNKGNYCYMNSILQCLFHTPDFADYFENDLWKENLNQRHRNIALSFANLLQKNVDRNKTLSCQQLKIKVSKLQKLFRGFRQQDAQEFLSILRQGISYDLNKEFIDEYQDYKIPNHLSLQEQSDLSYVISKEREDSIVTDYFQGQFCSVIKCYKCTSESLTFDNFLDLQLSFKKKKQITKYKPGQRYRYLSRKYKGLESIRGIITNFLIEGEIGEDYRCNVCQSQGTCTKKMQIFKFPATLVIQLKRFDFLQRGKYIRQQKIDKNVSVPLELDLSEFAQESTDQTANNPKYQLYGIVNHSGSINSGHYTTEVKSKRDNKWYKVNDTRVMEIKNYEEKELIKSTNAYVLFYRKI